ncbi:histidine phosphatase family protein [Cellulophaga sp. E16_2]|uniref:Phosphoglycerate mutase n=1 Tax=Cellulophaga algicola (strain DSM 14237 / IC166 / ACAM 630) TaxID=688270 RepID=E6X4A2_CELAD|nr:MULTISPECIES: histidine phosphatase family protein [Cellulophaga]ADV51485.1 Phosphoglycerate mutase [Cellulophaga algicola DSM 14237]MBO0593851.1 histidine phosphatase family protein [Cellulophaga sp. E16_2]
MKALKILLVSIILINFTSCKDDKPIIEGAPKESVVSTFYFIRHGEKDRSNPDNKDPELNQDGLGRAIRWERVFSEIDLNAIYSTDYDRTMMTAAPTAVSRELSINNYDPSTVNVEDFKIIHEGENILIVGHSNTTPDFVNKMLGEEKYTSMDDYDNSSLFIVRIIDGKATSIRLKMD